MEESASVTRPDEIGTTLSKIYEFRKQALDMMRLVRGKASVVKSLIRHCNELQHGTPLQDIDLSLSDVQDHIITMTSKLEHCEAILSRSHSDYLAQLSVDRIDSGNRSLRIIIRITVIAAIVVPLNAICGLFGTNVKVLGGDSDRLDWWFGILGLIVFIFLVSLTVARRMKLV